MHVQNFPLAKTHRAVLRLVPQTPCTTSAHFIQVTRHLVSVWRAAAFWLIVPLRCELIDVHSGPEASAANNNETISQTAGNNKADLLPTARLDLLSDGAGSYCLLDYR